MKPFNLEEALAGKPLVTRRGFPAKLLKYCKKKTNYPLTVEIDFGKFKYEEDFTKTGEFNRLLASREDLFMLESESDLMRDSSEDSGKFCKYQCNHTL